MSLFPWSIGTKIRIFFCGEINVHDILILISDVRYYNEGLFRRNKQLITAMYRHRRGRIMELIQSDAVMLR